MAVDPLKNVPLNRGTQLKREGNELGKGVRLYDVDLAIAEHMIDTVVPSVEAFREKIKVPVLYGNPEIRGAVIPFNVKNVHPHDLAKFLDTDGICIRAGHHCTQPIMNRLGINATARASFYIYNTKNDIEKLAESIKKTADIFK